MTFTLRLTRKKLLGLGALVAVAAASIAIAQWLGLSIPLPAGSAQFDIDGIDSARSL